MAVDGTFMHMNRYESKTHAVIETTIDGSKRDVFCVVPMDVKGRPQGTKVHAEGMAIHEEMLNIITRSTSKQLVLLDCKLTFSD